MKLPNATTLTSIFVLSLIALIVFGRPFLEFLFWSKAQQWLVKTSSPEAAAITLSKIGEGKVIFIGEIRTKSFAQYSWGVICNMSNDKVLPAIELWRHEEPWGTWDDSGRPLDDQGKQFIDQIGRFNRMIVSMPDFPSPHICKIDTGGNEYITEKKFLKDLNMSEADYEAHRSDRENSSIYTASYFGHFDGIKAHLQDLTRDDGSCYPLGYAKMAKRQDVIDFLVKNGADPEKECIPRGSTVF